MLEIDKKQQELDSKVEEIKRCGMEFAIAKRDYAIALRKEILKLRAEGYPTTIITDIARGNEEVAELRLKKDVAESIYKSCIESELVKKIELNILRTYYEREYANIRG